MRPDSHALKISQETCDLVANLIANKLSTRIILIRDLNHSIDVPNNLKDMGFDDAPTPPYHKSHHHNPDQHIDRLQRILVYNIRLNSIDIIDFSLKLSDYAALHIKIPQTRLKSQNPQSQIEEHPNTLP